MEKMITNNIVKFDDLSIRFIHITAVSINYSYKIFVLNCVLVI